MGEFKIIGPAELNIDVSVEYYDYEPMRLGKEFSGEWQKITNLILFHLYA